ncbi:hypothetical protein KP509_03G079700 [Ceratopteris richardii]|uniref:Germin-like protein n=1 Tax=Ceratopteris richardii TaxID=49495 RepID=A0A8T2V998_CERRI|nr:hypothetical protein KP509_03G079700 [Ceratopteris richardii]
MAFVQSFRFSSLLLVITYLIINIGVEASDPDFVQDICVANMNSTITLNGYACKTVAESSAEDFWSPLLGKPGNITSSLGSLVTLANVEKYPGLNTFGLSLARIDFVEGGVNPPHIHPRASEIVYLARGSVYVGFVTTGNKLFAKTINEGEMFLFPKGLIHFQMNVGKGDAVILAALSSQNPGTSQVARASFASSPSIETSLLAKAFQLKDDEVAHLKDLIAKT